MSIAQPRTVLINAELDAGINVRLFEPHPAATGVTIFCNVAGGATLAVFRVAASGALHQLGSSIAVADDVLSVTNYAYNTGPLRLELTPAADDSASMLEAQYHGHTGAVS